MNYYYIYIPTSDGELYHHGVKGMKWGVRKTISRLSQSSRRMSRAISAANIEERRSRIEQSITKTKNLQKLNKRDYRSRIKQYKAKLKRLNKLRDCQVNELSNDDIERGRSVYKTMKNVSMSVAITAVSTAVGTISMPAGVAAKLVGTGLSAAFSNTNADNE